MVQPYGPSLAAGDPSPALVGGASLPPHSPSKNNHIYVEAVGIPLQRKARKINYVDENRWDDGYDSDGEQGLFFDAVMDEPTDGKCYLWSQSVTFVKWSQGHQHLCNQIRPY